MVCDSSGDLVQYVRPGYPPPQPNHQKCRAGLPHRHLETKRLGSWIPGAKTTRRGWWFIVACWMEQPNRWVWSKGTSSCVSQRTRCWILCGIRLSMGMWLLSLSILSRLNGVFFMSTVCSIYHFIEGGDTLLSTVNAVLCEAPLTPASGEGTCVELSHRTCP